MKKSSRIWIVIALLALISTVQAFAANPDATLRNLLSVSQVSSQGAPSFGRLSLNHPPSVFSLNSGSKALTPTDVTSTNTYSVGYYLGQGHGSFVTATSDGVPTPFTMIITPATTSTVINYEPYVSIATTGVLVPSATSPSLKWNSNGQWVGTFLGVPNMSLWSTSAATITVEFWHQP